MAEISALKYFPSHPQSLTEEIFAMSASSYAERNLLPHTTHIQVPGGPFLMSGYVQSAARSCVRRDLAHRTLIIVGYDPEFKAKLGYVVPQQVNCGIGMYDQAFIAVDSLEPVEQMPLSLQFQLPYRRVLCGKTAIRLVTGPKSPKNCIKKFISTIENEVFLVEVTEQITEKTK